MGNTITTWIGDCIGSKASIQYENNDKSSYSKEDSVGT